MKNKFIHPINKTIGQWLEVQRLAARMSLKEAAVRVNLSIANLEEYEAGILGIPCNLLYELTTIYKADLNERNRLLFELVSSWIAPNKN